MKTNLTGAESGALPGTYAIWRNGDFVRLLLGRLLAGMGQQMLAVAVGWELYERTHSSLALGMVGLSELAAIILFTLPAGHLADNYARKRIIKSAICSSP